MGDTTRHREFYLTSALVLLLLLVIYVLPPPARLDETVDSSWSASLSEQFLHHAQCGRDLVFTYGPWGILGEPRGNPAIYPWLLFGRLVLALGLSLGTAQCALIYVRQRAWRWLWLVVFTALAMPGMLAPLVLLVVFFDAKDMPHRKVCLAFLAPACALAAHVKLVALPLVAALALLILFDEAVRRRRFPWTFTALAVWYAAFYLAAGQRVDSFGAYLRGLVATMSGYGGMALDGPVIEVVAGALLCAAMAVCYAAARGWKAVPRSAWLAAFFFVCFKQGFVRQDGGHIMAGMLMLAIPAAMLVAVVAAPEWRALRPSIWLFLAAEGVFFVYSSLQYGDLQNGLTLRWEGIWRAPRDYQKELAELRTHYPLEPLQGSVDIIPMDVFTLVAHQMDYRPRPVPQSYAVVNQYLSELNAEFLKSERAPDFVLFDTFGIDDRYPSTEDNLAWLSLLERYEPAGFSGSYLVLRKAREPGALRMEQILERTVRWREDVEIPAGISGAVWAEIEIEHTALGRLAGFLLRPQEVDLQVQMAGVWSEYRLLTGVARAGFVLSPVVEGPMPFVLLYRNEGVRPLAPTVSRISLWTRHGWFYRRAIKVRLYRLSIPERPIDALASQEQLLLAGSVGHSPEARPVWRVANSHLRLEANGLSVGSLPLDGAASRLEVSFGLQNQCAELADPNSVVEFRVAYRSRDGRVERTLLDRTLGAHGGEDATAREALALPAGAAGTLRFETLPRSGNCRAGAYWSELRLR